MRSRADFHRQRATGEEERRASLQAKRRIVERRARPNRAPALHQADRNSSTRETLAGGRPDAATRRSYRAPASTTSATAKTPSYRQRWTATRVKNGTALVTLGIGAGILMSVQRHKKIVQT